MLGRRVGIYQCSEGSTTESTNATLLTLRTSRLGAATFLISQSRSQCPGYQILSTQWHGNPEGAQAPRQTSELNNRL